MDDTSSKKWTLSQTLSPMAIVLGNACRDARKKADITQVTAANRCGCSPEFYGRVERGQALPSLASLIRIAEALNINPGALIDKAIPAFPMHERPMLDERSSRMLRVFENLPVHAQESMIRIAQLLSNGNGDATDGAADGSAAIPQIIKEPDPLLPKRAISIGRFGGERVRCADAVIALDSGDDLGDSYGGSCPGCEGMTIERAFKGGDGAESAWEGWCSVHGHYKEMAWPWDGGQGISFHKKETTWTIRHSKTHIQEQASDETWYRLRKERILEHDEKIKSWSEDIEYNL